MRKERIENSLVVNGGRPFNKRERKALKKYAVKFDLVERKDIAGLIPSKTYDLILVNWGLNLLNDEMAKQLLFNLRKQLTVNRLSPNKNGVIIIKEPTFRLDL